MALVQQVIFASNMCHFNFLQVEESGMMICSRGRCVLCRGTKQTSFCLRALYSSLLDSSCCTAVAGQFRLYCCGWTVQAVLLWLDSSCCTAVAGQFGLYCCGWTVHAVLLWLDSSGCTAVAGQFRLYCCEWTIQVILMWLYSLICTDAAIPFRLY